jgi:tetratricopeptide (TPR) repeat protein
VKTVLFKTKDTFLIFIPLILAVIVYAGTVNFSYVNWDDDDNIRHNPNFKEFNKENVQYHYTENRYKAISIWSYMLEYKMFGDSPKAHHTTNIIFHLLNIILVFVFIKRILPDKRFSPLIVAGLFAVHPAFVEAVAWITGRKDLLFVFFALLSFLSYIKYINSEKLKDKSVWFFVTGVLVYLASLAKIQAIALPVVLMALDWFFKRKINWEAIIEKALLIFVLLDLWVFALVTIVIWMIIKNFDVIKSFYKSKYYVFTIIICFWLIFHILTSFIGSCRFLGSFDFTIWIFAALAVSSSVIIVLLVFNSKFSNKIQSVGQRNRGLLTLLLLFFALLFILDFHHFNMIERLKYNMSLSNLLSPFIGFWNNPQESNTYFSIGERFLLMGFSLIYYLKRLFLLEGLNPMVSYPDRMADGSLPDYLFTDFILALIVIVVSAFIIFKYYRKNRIVLFGLLFFIINISLVLHIIPIEGRVVAADRYTYLSYLGLFILVGLIGDYFINKKKAIIVAVFLGSILFGFSINTYVDKYIWKDSFSLWEKSLEVDPENDYAYFSLGLAYYSEKNDPIKSIELYNRAIQLNEDHQYYNNRGRANYKIGNIFLALKDFDRAIEMYPLSFSAYNNKGGVLMDISRFEEAEEYFVKAIEINPDYQQAKENIHKLNELKELKDIIENNEDFSEYDKNMLIEFVINRAKNHIVAKEYGKAEDYYKKGFKIIPQSYKIYAEYGVLFYLQRKFTDAVKIFSDGLEYNPNNVELLLGRGMAYLEGGDFINACKDFTIAANQGDADAQYLLANYCN